MILHINDQVVDHWARDQYEVTGFSLMNSVVTKYTLRVVGALPFTWTQEQVDRLVENGIITVYRGGVLLKPLAAVSTKISVGDTIHLDGDDYAVETYAHNGDYYLIRAKLSGVHYSRYIDGKQVAEWLGTGRLKLVTTSSERKSQCAWHEWVRYTGATNVFDYCKNCDVKRAIDWKELK